MKSIHTLVPDIQYYISNNEEWYDHACENLHLGRGQRNPDAHNGKGRLRMSGLGDRCPRALWYSIQHPEMGEGLPADALFKYGYGHIIEAMALSLARLAGHSVEGEQDELVVDGVVGHRDALIDGCVVDVKSCSSASFNKIKAGLLAESDDFGYLYQLDGYILGSKDDPLCTVKDKGYILAIDKTLGHMALYEHVARPGRIKSRIAYYRYIVEQTSAPACECKTIFSKTAERDILDIRASYSAYKHICFPNLRTEMIKGRPYYVPH